MVRLDVVEGHAGSVEVVNLPLDRVHLTRFVAEIRILFKNTFFSKDALHRKNVFKKNSMPEFKVMIKTIMKIFFVGIEENPVNRQLRNFIQF